MYQPNQTVIEYNAKIIEDKTKISHLAKNNQTELHLTHKVAEVYQIPELKSDENE